MPVLQVCDNCCNRPLNAFCKTCGPGSRDVHFEGPTALEDFCKWLFAKPNRQSIAIAHNSRGLMLVAND